MRIHIPSVLELPPVLRILHKYKKRDLCRNLYKRITFYCTIIIKVTKSNLFIYRKISPTIYLIFLGIFFIFKPVIIAYIKIFFTFYCFAVPSQTKLISLITKNMR